MPGSRCIPASVQPSPLHGWNENGAPQTSGPDSSDSDSSDSDSADPGTEPRRHCGGGGGPDGGGASARDGPRTARARSPPGRTPPPGWNENSSLPGWNETSENSALPGALPARANPPPPLPGLASSTLVGAGQPSPARLLPGAGSREPRLGAGEGSGAGSQGPRLASPAARAVGPRPSARVVPREPPKRALQDPKVHGRSRGARRGMSRPRRPSTKETKIGMARQRISPRVRPARSGELKTKTWENSPRARSRPAGRGGAGTRRGRAPAPRAAAPAQPAA